MAGISSERSVASSPSERSGPDSVVLFNTTPPVVLIFKLNNGMVARTLEGLSDDDVWRQPGKGGNPIAWLLGHMANTRAHLVNAAR